jgi:hypothetical protein
MTDGVDLNLLARLMERLLTETTDLRDDVREWESSGGSP